ncbi:hypothetical protein DTA24_10005 [Klebsiella sp. P1CD1]|nr:hypothetical protein DTA24_10005 [Klebsiella sp. P1CD1]
MSQLIQTSLVVRLPLNAFVKATFYIKPNKAKRAEATPFARGYIKFWGYPMLIADSSQEALLIAEDVLRK